jgi:hypothetical protein
MSETSEAHAAIGGGEIPGGAERRPHPDNSYDSFSFSGAVLTRSPVLESNSAHTRLESVP